MSRSNADSASSSFSPPLFPFPFFPVDKAAKTGGGATFTTTRHTVPPPPVLSHFFFFFFCEFLRERTRCVPREFGVTRGVPPFSSPPLFPCYFFRPVSTGRWRTILEVRAGERFLRVAIFFFFPLFFFFFPVWPRESRSTAPPGRVRRRSSAGLCPPPPFLSFFFFFPFLWGAGETWLLDHRPPEYEVCPLSVSLLFSLPLFFLRISVKHPYVPGTRRQRRRSPRLFSPPSPSFSPLFFSPFSGTRTRRTRRSLPTPFFSPFIFPFFFFPLFLFFFPVSRSWWRGHLVFEHPGRVANGRRVAVFSSLSPPLFRLFFLHHGRTYQAGAGSPTGLAPSRPFFFFL